MKKELAEKILNAKKERKELIAISMGIEKEIHELNEKKKVWADKKMENDKLLQSINEEIKKLKNEFRK